LEWRRRESNPRKVSIGQFSGTFHIHERHIAPSFEEPKLAPRSPEPGTLVHADRPLVELSDVEHDAPSPKAGLRELQTQVDERSSQSSASQIRSESETVEDRVSTLLEVEEAHFLPRIAADAVEALRILRWQCRVRFDAFPLGDVFDDFNEFVDAVAVVAGESDELPRALDNRASFRCARDRDATPAPELEESLVAEHP
jgi:hypothetical protein